jgi:DNA-binding transcriptional LysR family regulator
VLAHEALGLQSLLLRHERLCAAVPPGHAWAEKSSLPWRSLAREPIILLARREGAGSHDAVLAACREAKFTPRLSHTPSLIGTVLQYVEAGAGIAPSRAHALGGRAVHFGPLGHESWAEKSSLPCPSCSQPEPGAKSVAAEKTETEVRLVPLKPAHAVPLVMVRGRAKAMIRRCMAFRALVKEWLTAERIQSRLKWVVRDVDAEGGTEWKLVRLLSLQAEWFRSSRAGRAARGSLRAG